jgi:uncharacterized membrane protein
MDANTPGMNLLGHPVHPMLVVFPLGLLSTAVIFDGVGRVTGSDLWLTMAFYLIGAGLIGGVLAALFGVLDWVGLPRATRAWRIGLLHGAGNVVVLGLFAASWVLRRGDPGGAGQSALMLALAGLLGALVTGWLGGELVTRLGVGVDSEADLDAPSSLGGQPGPRASSGRAPRDLRARRRPAA